MQIVGCQESVPVHATVFTPAAPTSIGVQFWGGGANGAGPQGNTDAKHPNYMVPTDIAGVQPQAYWNVATNQTGSTGDTTTLPDTMTDSMGKASSITFEFNTSGTWGAGTGITQPTQKLLNGIAGQSGTGTDQTMTFHNVPAGTHALLIYCVAAPLNYNTVKYTVGSQTYYIRVMNSDEYKPAPGFYRGTSTDPNKPSVADFVRFDNVKPDAVGDVTLTYVCTATGGQGNQTGVNALQLVLNAPAVGDPPVITQDPTPVVGPTNGTVKLTVTATGNNLTYQWRKSGKNLPNGGHISGVTTSTLTISSLSAADEGIYSVAVFNPAGSVVSGNASVYVSKYDINDAMVGYFKFDASSGSSAANSVTGQQAATLSGSPTWGKGQVANALSFDGGSTYGVVPNYPKATKALSVSGWVNVSAQTSSSVSFVRNADGNLAVGPADQGSAPASQFEMGLNQDANTGAFYLTAGTVGGANRTYVTAPNTFPMGSWHQVGFSADGAALRLYIDGKEVAKQAYLADFNIPTVQQLSFGARLATDNNQAPPVYGLDQATPNVLLGALDDVALWNRVVTADEMSKIYTAGKAGNALSTVTETPPVSTTPTVSVARTATGLTITFTGTLTGADVVNGPYTDVAGATSPYAVTATGTTKFYQARQ